MSGAVELTWMHPDGRTISFIAEGPAAEAFESIHANMVESLARTQKAEARVEELEAAAAREASDRSYLYEIIEMRNGRIAELESSVEQARVESAYARAHADKSLAVMRNLLRGLPMSAITAVRPEVIGAAHKALDDCKGCAPEVAGIARHKGECPAWSSGFDEPEVIAAERVPTASVGTVPADEACPLCEGRGRIAPSTSDPLDTPSDDGGWNDATRENHARAFPDPRPSETHSNKDNCDAGTCRSCILYGRREQRPSDAKCRCQQVSRGNPLNTFVVKDTSACPVHGFADLEPRPNEARKVDIEGAREALARLHTFGRGHGNNIAVNRDWKVVDDVLEALQVGGRDE